MTDIEQKPVSLGLEYVSAAGALIVAASRAGVFKLPHYKQAFQAYKSCGEILEVGKKDGFDMESVNKQILILIHNVVEFASNSNGFTIDEYDKVLRVLVAFREYLKISTEDKEEGKEEEKEEDKA